MHRSTLSLALVLSAVPIAATRGGEGCGVAEQIFETADLDRDGALSPEEYAAGGLERYGLTFEQTDTDGDGRTSLAEYCRLYEAHHPPRDPASGDAV